MESSKIKRKVILFKAPPEELDSCGEGDGGTFTKDRFVSFLNSKGIENELIPVLAFQYSNLDTLWNSLTNPGRFSGIIFTSRRCATSVLEAVKLQNKEALKWEDLRKKWISKRIYCVGPSTRDKVVEIFGESLAKTVITGDEAHAESLADKVIEFESANETKLPILYPCGSQRRDILFNKLKSEKIPCSETVTYETVKCPQLEERLGKIAKEELQNYQTEVGNRGVGELFLCFFSPSGVKYVFEHLDPSKLVGISSVSNDNEFVRIVSIGPTTTASLRQYLKEGTKILQCSEPTPEALLYLVNPNEFKEV